MKQRLNSGCAIAALMLAFPAMVRAGAPAGRIVDSKGKLVGLYSAGDPIGALRQVNNKWVVLPVSATGFVTGGVQLQYTTSDCSGTAYMLLTASLPTNELAAPADQIAIVEDSLTGDNILYYPIITSQDPPTENICSQMDPRSQDCITISGCEQPEPPPFEMATFDLASLKLIPPFLMK